MKYPTLILSLIVAIAHASTCPFKAGNEYVTRSRRPGIKEIISQRFQIRTSCKPNGFLAKRIQPVLSLLEGFAANAPHYLSWKRMAFGENFMAAGEVVLGEFDEVSEAMTNPQARTFRLGTGILDSRHLPGKLKGGPKRNLWLLAVSQKGAGGDGMHEALRAAMDGYIINGKAISRQKDDIAQSLMDQLVVDYRNMPHGKGQKFFTDRDHGIQPFMIKYMHYCLFGLNPFDKKKMDILFDFYYKYKATGFWMRSVGIVLNVATKFKISKLYKVVVQIYLDSPALASFPEDKPEFNNISKFELAHSVVPIMGIAALVGPMHLLSAAMGNAILPEYKDKKGTSKIDVAAIWDTIDLSDRAEVERFLYETGRLWNPVGHTHRVATEEFTVKMLGKDRTFPQGTVVSIPINMSMVNKNVWGETAFDFDHNRKNVIELSMIFQAVGNKNAGRICPGKWFAMNMMHEILVKCGEVRGE